MKPLLNSALSPPSYFEIPILPVKINYPCILNSQTFEVKLFFSSKIIIQNILDCNDTISIKLYI